MRGKRHQDSGQGEGDSPLGGKRKRRARTHFLVNEPKLVIDACRREEPFSRTRIGLEGKAKNICQDRNSLFRAGTRVNEPQTRD